MLTDIEAICKDWGQSNEAAMRRISAHEIRRFAFAEGSMAPKVEAACEFAEQMGGLAGVGRLQDVSAILNGKAGTVITRDLADTLWWD
jgi:carbamate kinase